MLYVIISFWVSVTPISLSCLHVRVVGCQVSLHLPQDTVSGEWKAYVKHLIALFWCRISLDLDEGAARILFLYSVYMVLIAPCWVPWNSFLFSVYGALSATVWHRILLTIEQTDTTLVTRIGFLGMSAKLCVVKPKVKTLIKNKHAT